MVKGFSPVSHEDFETDRQVNKGHWRLERRTLTASSALKNHLGWPGAEQVFQLGRWVRELSSGKETCEVVYGVTNLTREEASPARLQTLVRGHWAIENRLHYRRDETLREDWDHVRTGHLPRLLAALNNLVLGLLARRGVTNVPQIRRRYAAQLDDALPLIVAAQT